MTDTSQSQFAPGASTETAALAEILTETAAAVAVENITDDLFTVVTPAGATRTLLDVQEFAAGPPRTRGVVAVHRADSFVAAVNRLGGGTQTVTVYVDEPAGKLTAVLNDDTLDQPGWRDHRVAFEPRHSPEWSFWTSRQGLGEQQRFAETIEEGLDEITSPPAADLLEIAQTFHAAVQSEFRQAARLVNGAVQFVFSENIEAKAGASGTVDVPTEFTIRLAVYHGGDPTDLTARLRYRLTGGALIIGYTLVHPERAADEAFSAAVTQVLEDLDHVPAVHGTAPSPAGTVAVTATNVHAR